MSLGSKAMKTFNDFLPSSLLRNPRAQPQAQPQDQPQAQPQAQPRRRQMRGPDPELVQGLVNSDAEDSDAEELDAELHVELAELQ